MKSLEIKTFNINERLCIYEDFDAFEYISIVYVPNLNEPNHNHIDLSLEEAKKLKDFLVEYFEDKK